MNELRLELPDDKKKGNKSVKITEKRREKLHGILDELTRELEGVERARKKVKREKISFYTPKQNKKMIEEIKVPPLKLFKEEPKNKS